MRENRTPFLLQLSGCCLLALLAMLSPAACSGSNPPNVGARCTLDAGCDQGLTCDTTVDGGYCSSACATAGSTAGCPDQSICDYVSGPTAPECARVCTVQADCRADLECNGVTNSATKACKPK
jgi:hypothetical protein